MNIKIGKSTQVINLISGKVLNKKVSHSSSGKQIPTRASGDLLIKQLELVIKSFKSPILAKSILLKNVLPPLNEILMLLGKTSLEPGDADVLLIEKFLGSWIKKYGENLPESRKKELGVLRNLLVSGKIDDDIDDMSRIFFSNMAEEKKDLLRWKVALYREKKKSGNSEDDDINCVLDLSCFRLGEIRVVLSRERQRLSCRFFSEKFISRQTIRKSLPSFRDQLIKKGLEIPIFRINRFKSDIQISEIKNNKRVNLWG